MYQRRARCLRWLYFTRRLRQGSLDQYGQSLRSGVGAVVSSAQTSTLAEMLTRLVIVAIGLLAPSLVHAQDNTTPGVAGAPHPTLRSISLEWLIDGDDNTNGEVSVKYREPGSVWEDAMPLVRVPAGSNEGFGWANRHAGSIFGLVPGRTYEVELTLNDPDGGNATQTLMVAMRPEPEAPSDAEVVSATPETLSAVLASAGPNTIVELASGTYGEISVANDGEPNRPLILRAAEGADPVVEGDVRLDGRSHVWVQGLHVIGKVKFNNSSNLVLQELFVETNEDGIVAYGNGTADTYISDNVVVGTTQWTEEALGVNGDNLGEGIAVTGPGNVIAYNRVSNFRDCVSLLEDGAVVDQRSIDIIGNDLDVCADDAIEADFSMGNVRVVRNQMNNSFIALSSQPSLGGPTYFIRNVSFNNVFQVFKPNRGSVGDLWFHNTVVKPGDAMGVYAGRTWSRSVFRNNLLIGGSDEGAYNGYDNGDGRPMMVADADANCDFDYDGFGTVGGNFTGRIGATAFASFAELTSLTSEANATQVDMEVFASTVEFPNAPFPARETPDLRIAEGSAAVDRGEVLANLNDNYAGSAPDLGAYEAGASPPHYGPRGDAVCGNGIREVGETCDDGNLTANDGCSELCEDESEPPVGGADAGDGGEGGEVDGGCGCNSGGTGSPAAFFLAFGVFLILRRWADA